MVTFWARQHRGERTMKNKMANRIFQIGMGKTKLKVENLEEVLFERNLRNGLIRDVRDDVGNKNLNVYSKTYSSLLKAIQYINHSIPYKVQASGIWETFKRLVTQKSPESLLCQIPPHRIRLAWENL